MAINEEATITATTTKRSSKEAVRARRVAIERRARLIQTGRIIAIIIIVLISLAPLYWTFITSIKSAAEATASPPTLFPHSFTLDNYIQDFTSSPFFLLDLRNSFIISVITTVLCLFFGVLCAYALARIKFRGRTLVQATVLSVNTFPFIAMVGPLFVLFTGSFYIYNTYAALIIPDIVLSLPLTIWLLTSFFRDLPPDLEEAARIDGDSRLGALWHVIVPLTAPGVFAAAILSFIAVWNDFIFGLNLATDSNAQPVTVAISLFNGQYSVNYGQLAAAAMIVTVPLVILVLVFQRRIVSGLTSGAVKG